MGKKLKEKTVEYYDAHASEWAGEHGGYEDRSFWFEEMEIFNKYLPKGRVIEFGSGAGKDAKSLIRMGYDYVGTDASSGLIEIARKNNPTSTFLNRPLENLRLPKSSFDGFWTAATLLHIPKDRINKVLRNIKGVVKKGGVGFISLKSGSGEKIDEPTGRLFSYYSLDDFSEILIRNKFEILKAKTREDNRGVWWLTYWVKV